MNYTKRQVSDSVLELALYGDDKRGWGYVVFPLHVIDDDVAMRAATVDTDSTPVVGRTAQQAIEAAYAAISSIFEGDYSTEIVVMSHDGRVFLAPFPQLVFATAAWQPDPRKTRVAAQPSFPPLSRTST